MGLKIKMIEVNGEKRVPSEVMDLLKRFADHREYCDDCQLAFLKRIRNGYCKIGHDILVELSRQPGVEEYKD